jgi:hypothetical protein
MFHTTKSRQNLINYLSLLLVIGGTGLFLGFNASQRFDFYDMSGFMDAGYRVASGQKIYVDFFYIAGPLQILANAMFFKIFGFSLLAVQAHLFVINSILVAAMFWVGQKLKLPLVHRVVICAVLGISFYGPISHPWYDQNAWFWIILGVLLLCLHIDLTGHQTRVASLPAKVAQNKYVLSFVLGVFAALAFLTKSNVGAVGVGIMGTTLFVMPNRWVRSLFFLLGFATAFGVVVLSLPSPWQYIEQNFIAYFPIHRLGDNLHRVANVAAENYHDIFLALAAVLGLISGRRWISENKYYLWLVLIVCVGSILTTITGSLLVAANIPAMGVQVFLLALLILRLPQESKLRTVRKWRRGFQVSAALVFLLVASSAVNRSVNLVAWSWNPLNEVTDFAFSIEGFQGWKGNSRYGKGVEDSVHFFRAHAKPGDSVLVMPDSQIIYGLAGVESFKGAPFIFGHAETVRQVAPIRRFQEIVLANPPVWVVLHEDRMPLDLDLFGFEKLFSENYIERMNSNHFRILELKRAQN